MKELNLLTEERGRERESREKSLVWGSWGGISDWGCVPGGSKKTENLSVGLQKKFSQRKRNFLRKVTPFLESQALLL